MLDLVPLARPRWKMTDRDGQARREESDLRTQRAAAQSVDGDAGGGDDALNAKQHDRGGHGIHAEEPEDQGSQIKDKRERSRRSVQCPRKRVN